MKTCQMLYEITLKIDREIEHLQRVKEEIYLLDPEYSKYLDAWRDRGEGEVKFFCKTCGKELWEYADWETIKSLTLEQAEYQLVCSDCLLKEIKLAKER